MKKAVAMLAAILMLMLMAGVAVGETLEPELLFDAAQGDSSRAVYASSCNSSYGYRDIVNNIGSEEMQLLYEAIDEATSAFWLSSADLSADTLMPYAYATIDVTDLSLDVEQLSQVYSLYRMDHPLYYWLPDSVNIISDGTIRQMCLCSWEEYASGTYRTSLYSRITSAISKYSAYCSGASSRYTKATATLYLMAQKIDYAYNASDEPEESPWAHSIVGVFDSTYRSAVCEGYAKAYQLLMNYLGVPNVYIVGYAGGDTGDNGDWLRHAWNLLQMDDGSWYWTDPTWNDLDLRLGYGSYGEGDGYRQVAIGNQNLPEELYYRCRYTYHLKGGSFLTNHGPLLPSNIGPSYLYPLPDTASDAYVPDIAGEAALENPAWHNGVTYQPNFSSDEIDLISAGPIDYLVVQNDGLHRKVVAAYGNTFMREIKDVTIPSTVTLNGVVYDVVAVNLCGIEANVETVVISEGVKWIFGDLNYDRMVTRSLHIPASAEFIQLLFLSRVALSEITVAEGNPYIRSIDGVLYSRDGTVLIRYPVNKEGESFTLPSTVTELFTEAFRGNKYLKQIDLGETLERINVYAFGETAALESLRIPASVKLLPGKILTDNPSVKSISISAQTSFVWESIQGATGLESVEVEDGNPSGFVFDGALYMRTDRGTELVFYPGSRTAEIVTVHEDCDYIAAYAFTDCRSVGTVSIPAGCSVEPATFFRTGVAALDIAEGNTSINYADGAIYSADGKTLQSYLGGCRNEAFAVPDTVECIAAYAFNENPYIRHVTMSDAVTDVQAYAFKGCTALESVRLSDSIAWTKDVVTTAQFYRGIFQGASSLKSVNIPAAATHLPYNTFEDCSSLESLVLPATLQTIGNAALLGCESLKHVYILNPELAPADGTTNYKTDWTRAVLNARMNDVMYVYAAKDSNVAAFLRDLERDELRSDVFRDIDVDPSSLPAGGICGDGLTWSVSEDGSTLTVSGSGAMTDHTMYGTEPEWHWRWAGSVERIVIGEGVSHVGNFAFYGFEKVTEVSLPESLKTIGWNAFRACSGLRAISFGRNIERIYPRAFVDCTSLAEITFLCCPETENSIFENVTAAVYYIESMWTELPTFSGANLTWAPYNDLHPQACVSVCTPAYSGGDGVIGRVVCLDCGLELQPERTLPSGSIVRTGGGITTLAADSLDCGSAQQLVITENVTAIASRALADEDSLRLIMVPDSVVSIADDAFAGIGAAVVYCYEGSYCAQWLKTHATVVNHVAQRPAMKPGFYTTIGRTMHPVNGNIICPGSGWVMMFTSDWLTGCIGQDDMVWSSSDETIAYVDAGSGAIITGAAGTAVLTCRIMEHLELSAEVTVAETRPEEMSLPQTELVLRVLPGETIDLPCPVFGPEGSADAFAVYTTGNLVTLTEDGRFECTGVGTDSLCYVSACGYTALCNVRNESPVQIRCDESAELWAGLPDGENGTLQLECVLPESMEGATCVWQTHFDNISVDENGLVTALRGGDAWLVVYAYDASGEQIGVSDQFWLHVNSAMEIQGGDSWLYLSKDPLTVDLDVLYCLDDIPRSEITWSLRFEEGENRAVIDEDGLLTVQWPSTFVVRAQTQEGYWAEKRIAVKQGITEIVSVGTAEIAYGESGLLHLFTIYPSNVHSWTNNITISDPEILRWEGISETMRDEGDGIKLLLQLEGLWAGETVVTFSDPGVGISASVTVKVTSTPCQTHTVVEDEPVAATCTEDGLTGRQYCPDCGSLFVRAEIIPATGHAWTTDRLIPASCDEDGLIGSLRCANCQEEYRGEAVISRDRILTLPEGLRIIDDGAFQSTSAEQVVVPSGAQVIGSGAFADCNSLMLAVLPDSLTKIADDAFGDVLVLVIAPEGSYAADWAQAHGLLHTTP